MDTLTLGRTGLTVSRLGLGLAALGRPGYINLGHASDLGRDYRVEAMDRHAHAVLDAAWSAGVRYFDAARSYGRAEEFLAHWLEARRLGDGVSVGSKWGYTYTAGWSVVAEAHEVKDHGIATLRRQLAESRALLGGALGLYQIHSATLESGVLDDAEVHAVLAALRDEGVAVGLSVSGPRQGEAIFRALAVRAGGEPLFQSVQATWNLLEPSAGAALAAAHAAGLGVIVKEGLANGRLTARNTAAAFVTKAAILDRWCASLGTSRDALSLAAVAAQPWCHVVLSGAATVEQLRSNAAALDVPWTEEVARDLLALSEPPDRYWTTRAALAWN